MMCDCDAYEKVKSNNFKNPAILSEIESTGKSYKVIETIINNNRMILRIQKLAAVEPEEWDPPCDCLQKSPLKRSETKYFDSSLLSLTPIAENKQFTSASQNETIENPNVFLLKIRKRSETRDRKKENIDLEFRTPRPWPEPILNQSNETKKMLVDLKKNDIIEEKNDSIAPKKKKKKKKKNKSKKTKEKKIK